MKTKNENFVLLIPQPETLAQVHLYSASGRFIG
jgi:hypothetical protein